MKTIKTNLDLSDVGVLVDMIINASKETESLVIANWQLEIIEKLRHVHNQLLSDPVRD